MELKDVTALKQVAGQVGKQQSVHAKSSAATRPQEENLVAAGEALKKLENIVRTMDVNNKVSMYYDRDIGRIIIQVMDGESQQIVRQVPSDDIVTFLKKFKQYIGLVVNGRV